MDDKPTDGLGASSSAKAVGHDGKGMSGYDGHAWVTVAEQAIYNLVDEQLAMPHLEIEARLFDVGLAAPSGKRTTLSLRSSTR